MADDPIATIIGAAAALTGVGLTGLFGQLQSRAAAKRDQDAEHRRWIRDRKMTTYAAVMEAAIPFAAAAMTYLANTSGRAQEYVKARMGDLTVADMNLIASAKVEESMNAFVSLCFDAIEWAEATPDRTEDAIKERVSAIREAKSAAHRAMKEDLGLPIAGEEAADGRQ